VSKVLGKQKNDVDVNVLTKEEGETITPDKVFTLDLLKGEKLYLNLERGQKYFLSLVNGNSNTCLYIGQTQYKVENDKTIEIKFNVGGNYLIQTNLCDLRFKEHGTITVN
ncbi:MAG: hypothetical protein NUV69_04765, partial [Candidatus Curtissbacteria bacterium]|nr:hypothetical protein [Candidatus Curtissbacteria bacterium]